MDKKLIGVLIVVVIVIACAGAYTYYNMNNLKFGSSTVKAPSGFTQKAEKNTNGIVLTDKNTTIYINENHNKSIDEIITNYKNKYHEDTVVEKARNVGNISVQAITLKQANKTVHTNYYYQKDGMIYHVFMTGKNNQTALNSIVNSTSKSALPF